MKRSELTHSEILKVLELRADGKSYDCILAEGGIHHRREKVIEVVRWFAEDLSWEEAKAFCNNNQKILTLRDDFLEQKMAEAEQSKTKLENERQVILSRLAEQQKIIASQLGERYIDPFTGAFVI